jgi:hypothetical protein
LIQTALITVGLMLESLDVLPLELDGDQCCALTTFCYTVTSATTSSCDAAQSKAASVARAFHRALLSGSCTDDPRPWRGFMYELRALVDELEQTENKRSYDVMTLRRIVDENRDLFDER